VSYSGNYIFSAAVCELHVLAKKKLKKNKNGAHRYNEYYEDLLSVEAERNEIYMQKSVNRHFGLICQPVHGFLASPHTTPSDGNTVWPNINNSSCAFRVIFHRTSTNQINSKMSFSGNRNPFRRLLILLSPCT
jgi:hypothetical protein